MKNEDNTLKGFLDSLRENLPPERAGTEIRGMVCAYMDAGKMVHVIGSTGPNADFLSSIFRAGLTTVGLEIPPVGLKSTGYVN